jgi:hypothetical protein
MDTRRPCTFCPCRRAKSLGLTAFWEQRTISYKMRRKPRYAWLLDVGISIQPRQSYSRIGFAYLQDKLRLFRVTLARSGAANCESFSIPNLRHGERCRVVGRVNVSSCTAVDTRGVLSLPVDGGVRSTLVPIKCDGVAGAVGPETSGALPAASPRERLRLLMLGPQGRPLAKQRSHFCSGQLRPTGVH